MIKATIQCIHEEGIARASLQRIGRRANLSPGIVAHYFKDKNGLLAATLRRLNKALSEEIVGRLRRARTDRERLYAIVDAQFSESQFTPEIISTWYALWGKLEDVPELRRYQRIYEARLRSNLRHAMRSEVGSDQIDDVVDGLSALIDGLWVKAAQPTSRITASRAREIVRRYIELTVRNEAEPQAAPKRL